MYNNKYSIYDSFIENLYMLFNRHFNNIDT